MISILAPACFAETASSDQRLVMQSLWEAAATAQNEGHYEKAENYHRLLLKEIEAIKDISPIERFQQMNNLASALNRQEKYKEAEDLLKNAMSIVADTPGADEAHLVTLYGNLADSQYHLGDVKSAEMNYNKALELATKYAGPESSFAASDKAGLAQIYMMQDRFEEAKAYFEEALVVFERLGGKDHPVFKKTMNEYQALLLKMKQSGREK